MDTTLTYYNSNAEQYIQDTLHVEFSEIQNRFLHKLQLGDRILDFGCGSGRDAKYFIEQGFDVDAIDGSAELCAKAGALLGKAVEHMLFQELDVSEAYDGIWACASILHLPKEELKDVLGKMSRALKLNGIIYTSFKYGEFEGYRNGRYFTYFTEEVWRAFVEEIPQLQIEELWITGDVRVGRGEERWLNVILLKCD